MNSSRGVEHLGKEVPTQQGGRGGLIKPLGGNGEDTDCDCYKSTSAYERFHKNILLSESGENLCRICITIL